MKTMSETPTTPILTEPVSEPGGFTFAVVNFSQEYTWAVTAEPIQAIVEISPIGVVRVSAMPVGTLITVRVEVFSDRWEEKALAEIEATAG